MVRTKLLVPTRGSRNRPGRTHVSRCWSPGILPSPARRNDACGATCAWSPSHVSTVLEIALSISLVPDRVPIEPGSCPNRTRNRPAGQKQHGQTVNERDRGRERERGGVASWTGSSHTSTVHRTAPQVSVGWFVFRDRALQGRNPRQVRGNPSYGRVEGSTCVRVVQHERAHVTRPRSVPGRGGTSVLRASCGPRGPGGGACFDPRAGSSVLVAPANGTCPRGWIRLQPNKGGREDWLLHPWVPRLQHPLHLDSWTWHHKQPSNSSRCSGGS